MGVEENLYRAPETPVVERPAYEPRPFRVFLAGVVCMGVGVFFFSLIAWGCSLHVFRVFAGRWPQLLTNRRDQIDVVFLVLWASCGVTSFSAGRSFLGRRGRQGRRFLVASVASMLAVIVLVQVMGWQF